MLIQNTNPANVAPEQRLVKRGLLREDLFVAVHEQFLTETAELADIVMPATMFLEHDDIYKGGGQQHITLGPKLVEPPATVRSNHFVIEQLARRLGVADRPGFGLTERQLIDNMMERSGRPGFDALLRDKWVDCQPDFESAHYLNGFNWPGRKIPLPARLDGLPRAEPAAEERRHARPPPAPAGLSRPLRRHRDGGRRAPLPAGDLAGALLPQFDVFEDAVVAQARRPAAGDDASG